VSGKALVLKVGERYRVEGRPLSESPRTWLSFGEVVYQGAISWGPPGSPEHEGTSEVFWSVELEELSAFRPGEFVATEL
jgi:hypothetical protein